MLKTIRVERYQSHHDSTFNFSPGVNGIIGTSQSGKTAILRALKWILTNRPLGYRFHSDFSNKRTFVTAVLGDGSKVTINRGTRQSIMYSLLRPDGTFEEWAKMGKNVPDRVVTTFNFSELNIQNQLDPPFLILSSPGEVARTINRITKAEKLDKWIKHLNSKTNVLKYKRDEKKTFLKEIRGSLKKYRKLDSLEKKIINFEKVSGKIKDLEDEYEKIDELLANIKDTKATIRTQRGFLKAKKQVDQIEEIEDELTQLDVEKMMLESIVETIAQLRRAKKEHEEFVYKYTKILKQKKICPTCFSKVGIKDIERITSEIRTTK